MALPDDVQTREDISISKEGVSSLFTDYEEKTYTNAQTMSVGAGVAITDESSGDPTLRDVIESIRCYLNITDSPTVVEGIGIFVSFSLSETRRGVDLFDILVKVALVSDSGSGDDSEPDPAKHDIIIITEEPLATEELSIFARLNIKDRTVYISESLPLFNQFSLADSGVGAEEVSVYEYKSYLNVLNLFPKRVVYDMTRNDEEA